MERKAQEGGFGRFLYNSDTGEVLGRTGMSWAKIIIFYIIFYACLAAFFGFMLYVFYFTIDDAKPKFTQGDSLIGTNPGVGFRPQPDQDKSVDSTLIWFKKSDQADRGFWSKQLEEYVQMADKKGATAETCNYGGPYVGPERPCKVQTDATIPTAFGPCTRTNEFGYASGSPCILIKLNRIFDWTPKLIGGEKNPFDPKAFLDGLGSPYEVEGKRITMPLELRALIKGEMDKYKDNVSKQKEVAKSVWINCDGENPADRENIGHIRYYPSAAIPSYYFPFSKQRDYVSPFIMVNFDKPTAGVLINIECKAYSANISPDRTFRLGSVHFELMVE